MADMKAIRIHNFGGPEVLRFEDVRRLTPAVQQLPLRHNGSSVLSHLFVGTR
jgi:hypothetical protein